MKNTVLSYKPESNSLGSYRKERAGLYKQYMLLNLGAEPYLNQAGYADYPAVATVRLYWPAQTCYACVWLSLPDSYAIGKGKAGGYGYEKASAAVDAALRDAGVTLEHSIHGVGDSAILGALVAIARFAGIKNYTITQSHA